MRDQKIIRLASKIGTALEGEKFEDAGAAIGDMLGMFIMSIPKQTRDSANDGIDAIAADAKAFVASFMRTIQ